MTDLGSLEWRFIPEERRPGPMQMALDEVAAEIAGDGGPCTVRVYTWEPSTLSLGYNQSVESVDWRFCREESIDVTRRPTGGGGIYHDSTGDISYSIAVPASEVPGDLLECYSLLCEPVLDAFERMDIDAAFAESARDPLHQPCCYLRGIHPAHDVLVDGRKISGNAQYRQRDAVSQHGSLSYARTPDRHLDVFADPGVTPGEFRDRVTAIREENGIDRDEAVAALEESLVTFTAAYEGEWSAAELERARKLAAEKYADESWTHKQGPGDA